jgi:hypothetical protein
LLAGGIALGGLALFWGYILLGVYATVEASGGDATAFLAVPVVAFGSGVVAIAGGIVGRHRLQFGSILILVAGVAGLVSPVPAFLLNLSPTATVIDLLTAYLTVAWWAIFMVWVGSGVLIWRTRVIALKKAANP